MYDLSDLLLESTRPTAMLIAEEMDIPLEQVRVTLAEARPELVFNQFTAGTNTTITTYTPVRVAAAIAKGKFARGRGDPAR